MQWESKREPLSKSVSVSYIEKCFAPPPLLRTVWCLSGSDKAAFWAVLFLGTHLSLIVEDLIISENTKKGKKQNCQPIMCAVEKSGTVGRHSTWSISALFRGANCQFVFSWLSATPSVQPALSYQTSKHDGYIHPSSVTAHPAPRGATTNPSSLGDKVELSPGQVFGLDMCWLCSKCNHRVALSFMPCFKSCCVRYTKKQRQAEERKLQRP